MTPPDADQDYIVAGLQPWIDGVATEPGVVRQVPHLMRSSFVCIHISSVQFVGTVLGKGYTVEEQVTGKAEVGGFQFDVFPRRRKVDGHFEDQGSTLDDLKTPAELSVKNGEALYLCR